MLRRSLLGTVLTLSLGSLLFSAPDAAPPKIDKAKLEAYVRYAEGFAAEVKAQIEDPAPTPYKGYYRVIVHFSAGQSKLDRVYFVTSDGQHYVNGSIWDMNRSPFEDNLERLPTDGPTFGPANAKVTIVVFSDFECPFCQELAKTLRENVPSKYPNDVRVIFRDFPIPAIHPWATAAAEASHCIVLQKPAAFWAFHDWIFDQQKAIDPTNLKSKVLGFAKGQNLDVLQLSGCMDAHATLPEVEKSEATGRSLQIDKTPTMFMNGRMIPSALPWAQMDAVIKMELNRPKEIAVKGSEKCCEVTLPIVGKN